MLQLDSASEIPNESKSMTVGKNDCYSCHACHSVTDYFSSYVMHVV